MKRIDELHMELPFAGSRMLRDLRRQSPQTFAEFDQAATKMAAAAGGGANAATIAWNG